MALSEAELVACYERVQHRLYNVLYRLLWQAQDCQDVMHEAFLQVWRRRGGVGAESLEGLVFTTALNLARNQLRWQSLRAFVGLDQAPPAPGAGGDESPALRRALQRLFDHGGGPDAPVSRDRGQHPHAGSPRSRRGG